MPHQKITSNHLIEEKVCPFCRLTILFCDELRAIMHEDPICPGYVKAIRSGEPPTRESVFVQDILSGAMYELPPGAKA